MDLAPIFKALEGSGLAVWIRDSLLAFPLLEAVHVVGLALVFGTIMIVDLRILGVASTERAYRLVSGDMLKLTWGAFAITALTGLLMFITNARVYADNPFFRVKLVLLALAGLNMLVFQLTAARSSHRWDESRRAPGMGRAAAAMSLMLWILVIGMGRAIGFTTTGKAVKEAPPPEMNFDDFLASGPAAAAPPPAAPQP